MKTMDKRDIIDKYIKNELSGEEIATFENELNADPQLMEEVKLHRMIDEALKEKDVLDLHEQLESIYQYQYGSRKPEIKAIQSKEKRKVPTFIKTWYKVAAAAAVLIAITGLLYFMLRPSQNERLYAQNYTVYPGEAVRSGTQADNSLYQLCMDEYNLEHYENAWGMFKEFSIKEESNMKTFLYRGVAAMETDNFDDAITSFKTITDVKNNKSLYSESAEWYLALCYLKKGDKANALSHFTKIAGGTGVYKTNAENILIKLND